MHLYSSRQDVLREQVGGGGLHPSGNHAIFNTLQVITHKSETCHVFLEVEDCPIVGHRIQIVYTALTVQYG